MTRAAAFRRAFEALEGERLSRVPRGFPKDDPAAAYLKHRNFLAGREFPPELATTRDFYPTLLATFKAVMPIVRFLNEPLVPAEKSLAASAHPLSDMRFSTSSAR